VKRWRRTRFAGRVALGLLILLVLSLLSLDALFPFPLDRLQRRPVSPYVTDRTGRVLLARVAADDQWRRPIPLAEMSPWLIDATIAVEDERFRSHAGVDPLSVARAVGQNLRARRVVSGASTLTMQICRMLDDRPRSLGAKVVESFRALQLERCYDKDRILETYLNMAPYGGNRTGVEAAARVYFDKSAGQLSLAEAALLAGLPQSPNRYRPDFHLELARARQRTVLWRMRTLGMITDRQMRDAAGEPITIARRRNPLIAPHAATLALARRPAGGQSTIDAEMQAIVAAAMSERARTLPAGTQIAVAVIDIASAEIRVLVGSRDFAALPDGQVNGAIARRSPGSALKPFVYAAAFDAGRLGPDSLVPDVPIERSGWSPHNFDGGFAGDVTAADALRRSLNIPAILVAEALGLERCAGVMQAAGVDLPRDAVETAGLALVVGGVEVSLLDLTNAYATLGREGVAQPPRLFADDPTGAVRVLQPATCAALDAILSSRARRPNGWDQPGAPPEFMWKTGTSAGRRDAWAVGHNTRFAIGVWVGRFAGAGSPQFVGAAAAEPLLTKLFTHPAFQPAAPRSGAAAHADAATNAGETAEMRLRVENPLEFSVNRTAPLRILYPAADSLLLAPDATLDLIPRANRPHVTWFLDGQLAPASPDHTITEDAIPGDGLADDAIRGWPIPVAPGRHNLRCVTPEGTATRVTFTVQTLHPTE